MYRCGIPRDDETVRIGILCDKCSFRALEILLDRGKPFFKRQTSHDTRCEACLEYESLAAEM